MARADTITYSNESFDVQMLARLYQDGRLNLQPGFQRQSVWNPRDRAKLIDSILRQFPLPAIFLYRRHDGGEIVCDVIDGKQRLESIFMFMGVIRGHRFKVRAALPGDTEPSEWDWPKLVRVQRQSLVGGYMASMGRVSAQAILETSGGKSRSGDRR